MPKAQDRISTWQLVIAVMTIIVAVSVLAVQWQSSADQITGLKEKVTDLEVLHDKDIARLDESNRTRRIEIGGINSRLATLEERTE